MALKALIFADNYKIYWDFIQQYHLNRSECKYAHHEDDMQGFHRDTNPELRVILLGQFWSHPHVDELLVEITRQGFGGRTYYAELAETAARLIQLGYITDPKVLPEYLAHENGEVREAARAKQQELRSE